MNKIIFLAIIFPILIYSQSADSNTSKNKCEVKMKLAKDSYKEYEPIVAKFDVINYGDKPFNINSMFFQYLDETNIYIEDDSGNIWHNNVTLVCTIDLGPAYILQPNDTLIISMPINNWGVKIKGNPLFAEFGYLPAGRKYKAYFLNKDLKSNEVEFDVILPNEIDEKVIHLYKDIYGIITREDAAKLALAHYPDNIFTEHLQANNLYDKYFTTIEHKNKYNPDEIVTDYVNYINKYPASFYIYDDTYFMKPLYYNLFYQKKDFYEILADIKKRTKNTLLYENLNNGNLIERLKALYDKLSYE